MKSALLSLLLLLLAGPILAQQSGTVATEAAIVQSEGSKEIAAPPLRNDGIDGRVDTAAYTQVHKSTERALTENTDTEFAVGPTKILSLKKICWLPFKRATYS